MSWFYNLKIGKKLILTFLITMLIVSAMSVFSILQLKKVNHTSKDIADNWLPSIQALGELKLSLARIRSSEFKHILTTNAEQIKVINKETEEKIELLKQQEKKYALLITEKEEREIYEKLSVSIKGFIDDYYRVINASEKGDKDLSKELINNTLSKNYLQMLKELDQLTQINAKGAHEAANLAEKTYEKSLTWIISLLVICTTISMIMAITLSNIISKQLNIAVNFANRVSEGDLTFNINDTKQRITNDETGQLIRSLEIMNNNLYNIVSEVRQSTDTITTASSEISAGNLDLSNRTEQQASSLEETASAIEELTATVKQNADNTSEAKKLSSSTSELAKNGGDMVNELVNNMSLINEASHKIVDIISVIDNIAFQTNILALNAAVEAARAGEQGRGFAVVASEVRNLAQKSATAAKEIKELINDSVTKVHNGTEMAEKVGLAMTEVVSSVSNVTTIIAEITTASHEQSTGISEVNKAVGLMDQVTQQNAALVEEATAAAISLQEQANKLSNVVSVFKV